MRAETIAVVTGGSRGIGRAAAIRLAQAHAGVVISFRAAAEAAAETVAAIEATGAAAVAVGIDLAERGAAAHLVDVVLDNFGRLDVVVNNAGIAERCDFFDLDLDAWDRTIATNLTSAFAVLQAAARVMLERGGAVVNLGSPAGTSGGITGAHYAASKGGIVGLTAYAAKALAKYQIRVNLIEPAFVETDMVLEILADDPSLQAVLSSPLGRRGRPEEAAEVIAFLCSPAASYVSGARISVSGAASG